MDRDKEEFWREILKEHSQSNKSNKQFCKEYGIEVWQFYYWKKRLSPELKDSSGFKEFGLTKHCDPGVYLIKDSLEIRLDYDFDPGFLQKVLGSLNC